MARGGARPGAGRKKLETHEYQAARRQQLQDRVTPEVMARIIDGAIKDATEGEGVARARAREWLTPWILGAVPRHEEIDVNHFHNLPAVNFGRGHQALQAGEPPTVIPGEARVVANGQEPTPIRRADTR